MNQLKSIEAFIEMNSDLLIAFKNLTELFSHVAQDAGIDIRPYQGKGPKYFQLLPEELQASVLTNFFKSAEAITQVASLNESFDSGHKLLWRMIQNLKLRPTKDLFSILEDDDVIEIYQLPQCVQIFRNMRFYQVCSYTLDEILCRPFWDLYHRDESVTQAIMEKVSIAASRKKPQTMAYEIDPYVLTEIDSTGHFVSMVENKFLSPLFDGQNNVVAMVNIMSGRVINKDDTKHIASNRNSKRVNVDEQRL